MVFNRANTNSTSYCREVDTVDDDKESSIVSQHSTPAFSSTTATMDDRESNSKISPLLVSWPGSTFIIRSIASGKVITLLNGRLELTELGGEGSSH